MKIFELNTKLTSYSYPLAKIIISVMIVLFSIFRNNIFTISLKPLSFLVTLIYFIATLAAILCTYISIGELFYVRKNKKKQSREGFLVCFFLCVSKCSRKLSGRERGCSVLSESGHPNLPRYILPVLHLVRIKVAAEYLLWYNKITLFCRKITKT